MKRLVDYYLKQWKHESDRKPLLLRGARQVGKTHAVRTLGSSFENLVEINFEYHRNKLLPILELDFDPHRIIKQLAVEFDQPIIPGKTLLFFDEIQMIPDAVTALRYFYEMMPELHVIAAGSLLDFAIKKVGMPVGRVESFYMHPMSFIEFLVANGNRLAAREILTRPHHEPMSEPTHNKLLSLVSEYMAIGGMPQAVLKRFTEKNPLQWGRVYSSILDTYRQDFEKYSRKRQVKYLSSVFNSVPRQLGHKFKYSHIEGEFRKRELVPAFDLLETAGIIHRIYHSAGQGVPLGAQIDFDDYKAIFVDIALSQHSLGMKMGNWFLSPMHELVNKGALVEAFVGQEILTYDFPFQKNSLFYWNRKERTSQAEVDYLIAKGDKVIPVEAKSGAGTTLKSLHMFLQTHKASPYGVRFSIHNYSVHEKIHSYPLYAVVQVMTDHDEIKKALLALTE